MVPSITVKSYEEFKNLQGEKALQLSSIIIETIINNLNSKKKHIPLVELTVQDQDRVFDITIDRDEFINILKIRLPFHEALEDFETCVRIVDAIKFLEKKQKNKTKKDDKK